MEAGGASRIIPLGRPGNLIKHPPEEDPLQGVFLGQLFVVHLDPGVIMDLDVMELLCQGPANVLPGQKCFPGDLPRDCDLIVVFIEAAAVFILEIF